MLFLTMKLKTTRDTIMSLIDWRTGFRFAGCLLQTVCKLYGYGGYTRHDGHIGGRTEHLIWLKVMTEGCWTKGEKKLESWMIEKKYIKL